MIPRATSVALFCLSIVIALMLLPVPVVVAVETGQFLGDRNTEYPTWFKDSFLDLQEDIDEASAKGKRLMLFFYQDGCPYCNALVERNLAQKDIEQKVRKNLDVIAINMWGDRSVTHVDGKVYSEKTLAAKLKVQFTPTVLFFGEHANVILRLNGYRSPQRFSMDVDYVVQRKEKEHTYRDYVAANRPAVRTRKKLNSEVFFQKGKVDLSQKARSPGRPFAVFFEQQDCPNCDRLHNTVLPDIQLRAVMKNVDIVQLDMWSKNPLTTPDGDTMSAREWAKKLDVRYAPSIVIFNPQGKEIIRTEAFFKVFHTQAVFSYVLSEAYRKQPSFQRYLSEYADHLREQGRDVNIWRLADEKK
ncbi:MAG: thioredoxin fold domain-containing protein [Gammaproteobacteria bacterium]|nr:thioredoxin fold domain-containing protein [Gammaproteobacteria bacterium]